jgi:DNA-binding transcriptional ArsR family regulator
MLVSHMAQHDTALSEMFQALSDPTRRAMLARMGRGAVTVSALAAPTGMALPTILRHLAVLEGAGLITTVKVGRARECAVVPGALGLVQDWLGAQRAIWEARTDRLEAFVETLKMEQRDDV